MTTTVHRIGNRSKMDDMGRLTRFRASTLCGRSLHQPQVLTDNWRRVTCGRCRLIQRQWTTSYWVERIRAARKARRGQ